MSLKEKIASAKTAGELIQILESNLKDIQAKDLVMITHKLSLLKYQQPAVIETLEKLIKFLQTQDFKGFDVTLLINLLTNLTKLNGKNSKNLQNSQNMDSILLKILSMDIRELDRQSLPQLVWNLAKGNLNSIHSRTLVEKLVNRAKTLTLAHFKPYNVGRLAWGLGKLGRMDKELYEQIADYAIQHLDKFTSSELSNIVWAFSKVNYKNNNFIKNVIHFILSIDFSQYNSQDLGNLAYAFASLEIRDENFFEFLAFHFINIISTANSQELANAAWAFATLEFRNEVLFEAIARSCLETRFKGFIAQEFSNLAWAFAKNQHKNLTLFNEIASACRATNFKGFVSQHFSNLAWAFATLEILNLELMTEMAKKFMSLSSKEEKAQHLVNMAWSFSVLDIDNEELIQYVQESIIRDIHPSELTAQSIGNLAHATVKLNGNVEFLNYLAEQFVASNFRNARPQTYLDMIQAFAAKRFYNEQFIEALTAKLIEIDLKNFDLKDISALLNSLANLNLIDNALIKLSVEKLRLRQTEFTQGSSRYVTEILWSFAVIGLHQTELFQALLDCYTLGYDKCNFKNSIIHANQIIVFKHYCELNLIKLKWDPKLLDHIERSSRIISSQRPASKYTHLKVYRHLIKLFTPKIKAECQNEYFFKGYFIDIALFINDDTSKRKIAIEIMGDGHFVNKDKGALCLPDRLKQKFLLADGWEFVIITNEEVNFLKDQTISDFLIEKMPFLKPSEPSADAKVLSETDASLARPASFETLNTALSKAKSLLFRHGVPRDGKQGLEILTTIMDRKQGLEMLTAIIEKFPKECGEAHYLLGWVAEKEQKFDSALASYKQAADLGFVKANYSLGLLLELGLTKNPDREKDLAQAIEYYKHAAKLDNKEALLHLGKYYEEGKAPHLPVDVKLAEDCYKRAAQQGCPQAEEALNRFMQRQHQQFHQQHQPQQRQYQQHQQHQHQQFHHQYQLQQHQHQQRQYQQQLQQQHQQILSHHQQQQQLLARQQWLAQQAWPLEQASPFQQAFPLLHASPQPLLAPQGMQSSEDAAFPDFLLPYPLYSFYNASGFDFPSFFPSPAQEPSKPDRGDRKSP